MFEMTRNGRWLCGLGIVFGTTMVFGTSYVCAQITPDGTLPNNSIVTPNGNAFNITGGTTAGGNLFHSFREFSVPSASAAIFNNALNITNIISRVTGGSISNIDGLIGTSGSANLFLINPNGIIFGQNASLNVGGSFVASTASAIQFGNQGFFSATNPDASTPLLTINPTALFYNRIAGRIENNSIARDRTNPTGLPVFGLRVPDGKSLLLIGGNINMNGGQLNAYGGRIELSGLANTGSVALSVDSNNVSAGLTTESAFADVSLTNGARVYVEAAGGGSITVNARNIDITSGSRLSAGIGFGLGEDGAVAGDIALNATGEINIVNSTISNNVLLQGIGDAGNVNITTTTLSLTNGARLSTSTFGLGDTGNVIINARESVSFDDRSAAISVLNPGAVAKGGDIQISAETLSLTNGAQLIAATLGQGDAGNVIINARGSVSFDGISSNGIRSSAGSVVEPGGVGKSGNIQISAETLSLTNGAALSVLLRGQGNAGNIQISTNSLSLTNSAQLIAGTNGKGDAGNVRIDARGNVSFDDGSTAFSVVEESGVGNGGNIQISAETLSLTNGAQLIANTFGQGNAGNVIINARGRVSFDGSSSSRFGTFLSAAGSTVEQGAVGNGGNIQISADSLSLTNGAQLAAYTRGKGDAGNVIINARGRVSFDGTSSFSRFSSSALSVASSTAVGKGGDINISAASLSLTNGVQLLALTEGKGDAGNIEINVTDSVNISGTSSITGRSTLLGTLTTPNSTGIGGNITVNTPSLRVSDGAVLDARTGNNRNGGNITLNVRRAEILNGGQLISTSSGAGNAGNIIVNATDRAIIDGSDRAFNDRVAQFPDRVQNRGASSGLFVLSESTGSPGNIEVTAPQIVLDNTGRLNAESTSGDGGNILISSLGTVTIGDGAEVSVNSRGTGTGGDISVQANSLTLDRGTISAQTARERGGNITLRVRELLLLRRDSRITTNAGTQSQPEAVGDGGNINIDTRFLVAQPSTPKGSDITANATYGNGGRVDITATGVFGIEFREEPRDKLNDITASSEFGGTPGVVEINRDIDPSQNLVELLADVVDPNDQIAQNACTQSVGSEFIITGRGGLPPSPNEDQSQSATVVGLVESAPSVGTQGLEQKADSGTNSIQNSTNVFSSPVVPAQGWVFNDQGDVVLTAHNSTVTTPQRPPKNHGGCPALQRNTTDVHSH